MKEKPMTAVEQPGPVEARILELRAGGDGILKIGRKLGIGTSVVQRVFKERPQPSR
jgi:hypothetical protein